MDEQKKTMSAKVFMHGRSQAVRLPKAFRFQGSEVQVRRIGDKVVLEPMPQPPFRVTGWRDRLRSLGARDFLPEGRPAQPPISGDGVSFD